MVCGKENTISVFVESSRIQCNCNNMIDVNVKLLFPPSTFSSTSSSSFSPNWTMPSSDAPLHARDASGYSAYQE